MPSSSDRATPDPATPDPATPDPATPDPAGPDPRAEVDRLAAARHPYLIGVRHHSPVLAAAVPALLDAFAPDLVLVELPPELGGWLGWLGHPETVAPVAVAAADGGLLAFYPYADFSPELAAIRWAARAGVEVRPCDAPLGGRGGRAVVHDGPSVWEAVGRRISGRADEDVWDRLVEAGAPGSEPEAVRRAALVAGWLLRHDSEARGGVDAHDLGREAWMRAAIGAGAGRRIAAVVGAFHAPALLTPRSDDPTGPPPPARAGLVTSLVPYPFALLDARSGYPAGIRDPQWQQDIFDAGARPEAIERLAGAYAVRVTVRLRQAGHPAGPAEAAEVARVAGDLARLRGLPAPARGELVEALQLVLAQGQVMGRGRVVADAMRDVLIGVRHGRLAPGTPVTGLLPAVEAELRRLRLPGRGEPGRPIRLDPLRSKLDREREIALCRLAACAVPYGRRVEVTAVGGDDALTTSWTAAWQTSTPAVLAIAGLRGVTLAQAAFGTLQAERQMERDAGGPTAAQAVAGLAAAAECGLTDLVAGRTADVASAVVGAGSLSEILAATELVERIQRGHLPGVPEPAPGLAELLVELDAAAVRELDGLTGSDQLADAQALLALALRGQQAGGSLRLHAALVRLARDGTPLMRGAAAAVLTLIGLRGVDDLAATLSSLVDVDNETLRRWLAGTLVAAAPLLAGGNRVLGALLERVETMTDAEFTGRLPALRGGFDAVSPAGRTRLLEAVEERVGTGVGEVEHPSGALARWHERDEAGRAAAATAGLLDAGVRLAPADRWRLVLGRRRGGLSPAGGPLARALDELYGEGQGEGSHSAGGGGGGGRDAPYPSVREWRQELTELFGEEVCTEVLAAAADRGRVDAALELNPDQVRPSVELLHTVLSLAGGLPEARLAALRPLVARLVRSLAEALSQRLRPALTGITTPRPTRRRTGALDLAATIRANLRTVRPGPDGPVIVPERPLFRGRAKRSLDWRMIVVVDVSGSMEASTIWAALTASILAGVPALTTHFVTFSTHVVDLTDHVDDPLSLLLEIQVGGGTHIAAGLRYAAGLVTNPTRTIVALISDFEEGFPIADLLAAVRTLAESGCRLIGCASLDDQARPRYSVGVAQQVAAAGMPVAALSPLALARWVAEQVR